MSMNPPPGTPRWGAAYRDFLAKYFTRYAAIVAQTENLPYADQTIDLDPHVRDQWGLPAPRLTYDWRRPNEMARAEFLLGQLEQIARATGATHVWRAPLGNGAPGAHHEGGTRMGSDPKNSVVNRYGQSWDIPNLVRRGELNVPDDERFQSDAHHSGPRLHERRCDRESLQEKSRPARLAPKSPGIFFRTSGERVRCEDRGAHRPDLAKSAGCPTVASNFSKRFFARAVGCGSRCSSVVRAEPCHFCRRVDPNTGHRIAFQAAPRGELFLERLPLTLRNCWTGAK